MELKKFSLYVRFLIFISGFFLVSIIKKPLLVYLVLVVPLGFLFDFFTRKFIKESYVLPFKKRRIVLIFIILYALIGIATIRNW